jgi:sirohydrochlorin ferrochelatase
MQHALLIIGHGSRSKEAVDIFEKIVEYIKEKSLFDGVFGAQMQISSPGIEETIENIYINGFRKVIVVPYFLYEGNHIKFDIPEIISIQKKKYPDITFKIGKPLGYEPVIADILIKRAKEAEL